MAAAGGADGDGSGAGGDGPRLPGASKFIFSVTQLDQRFVSHRGQNQDGEEGVKFMHENSVCSMNPDSMDELDIFENDYVLVKGRKKRATVLQVEADEEVPVGQVGIHQNQRKNLAVSPTDRVFIEPATPQNLRSVKVAPIAETVEGVTGDLNRIALVPYFQAEERVVRAGDLFCVYAAMNEVWFRVEEVESQDDKDYGIVRTDLGAQSTALDLMEKISQEDSETDLNQIGYDDIGGLKEQLQKIRETVELPLKHPRLFRTLGVRPPKGVLMHGPPGTGKTMIARAIANETGCIFKTINGPEIMSGQRGGSEKALRDMFQNMEEIVKGDEVANGAILFIDEIDAIAPNRDKTQDETMRRVVATLLTCMDGIKGDVHIMVIGATNRPNALDPALRRAGRFDTEIIVPVPSKDAREEILQILTRKMKLGDDVDLTRLAEVTHGYVGADLASLCMKAAVTSIRRSAKGLMDMEEEDIPAEYLNSLRIDMKDFYGAMSITVASSMRDVVVETPDVKFADIGGLEEVKQSMREMVEMPVKHPEYFEELGVDPPSGALLYGPPGCGKTLIAKAMANECESNFISIKGPQLLTKWFGESEENVREVFDKARQAAPCILFFDELDSIASQRGGDTSSHGAGDSTVNQLLTELDGVGERKNVFVVGATNRPDQIDSALRRPGRLDQLIYIPLPDREGRLAIFKAVLRKTCVARDVDVQALCDSCDKFTGSDVAGLCQLAVKISVRERLTRMMDLFKQYKAEGSADSVATKRASDDTQDWAVSTEAFQKARASTKRSVDDRAMEEYAQHKQALEAQMDVNAGAGGEGDDRVPAGMFARADLAVPELGGMEDDDDDDIYD